MRGGGGGEAARYLTLELGGLSGVQRVQRLRQGGVQRGRVLLPPPVPRLKQQVEIHRQQRTSKVTRGHLLQCCMMFSSGLRSV